VVLKVANTNYKIHYPKWMYVIREIKEDEDRNIFRISHFCDITYSHAHGIVRRFVANGVLDSTFIGRSMSISLTDKGRQLKNAVLVMFDVLGEGEK